MFHVRPVVSKTGAPSTDKKGEFKLGKKTKPKVIVGSSTTPFLKRRIIDQMCNYGEIYTGKHLSLAQWEPKGSRQIREKQKTLNKSLR